MSLKKYKVDAIDTVEKQITSLSSHKKMLNENYVKVDACRSDLEKYLRIIKKSSSRTIIFLYLRRATFYYNRITNNEKEN